MPILPSNATAAQRARAADEVEQRAQEIERTLSLVALRLFSAERDAMAAALARVESDVAVRAVLDAIIAAYRAPAGLFRRAWTEALGELARTQYVAEAERVRRETARVVGRDVALTGAARVQLEQAATERAALAAAEITATSAAHIEAVAAAVGLIPADVLRELESLRESVSVPPIVVDISASARPVGEAPLPRPLVIQQRVDSLAPLIGREAAEQVIDQVAATLAQGKPTRAVVRAVLREVTATPVSRVRAERIARTESIGLLNSAERDAVKAADVLRRKRWVTQLRNVRDSHQRCARDGIIPIDQPHSNGLQFPGQRPAPAREVINCRCSESYLP